MPRHEIRTLQSFANLRIFSISMWWIVRKQFPNHLYVFPFRCLESRNQTLKHVYCVMRRPGTMFKNEYLTWRNFNPPNFTVIWMLDEFASKLFSMSSFNAFAGRRIISPAAIRFTTTASSFFITPGSIRTSFLLFSSNEILFCFSHLYCCSRQTVTFDLTSTGCSVCAQHASNRM